MVLKSLEDAIRDGDTIRAVIRGTGTNQDGGYLTSVTFSVIWLIHYSCRQNPGNSPTEF